MDKGKGRIRNDSPLPFGSAPEAHDEVKSYSESVNRRSGSVFRIASPIESHRHVIYCIGIRTYTYRLAIHHMNFCKNSIYVVRFFGIR